MGAPLAKSALHSSPLLDRLLAVVCLTHPSFQSQTDNIPRPRLRDATVQTTPFPQFDSFFVPYTTTLSLNWPYTDSDVLLPSATPQNNGTNSAASPGSISSHVSDPNEPFWRMNPVFETHVRDLRNWSLGTLFRDAYPQWAETVRIKEGR